MTKWESETIGDVALMTTVTPTWVYVLIALGVVIVLLLIILIFATKKKSGKKGERHK